MKAFVTILVIIVAMPLFAHPPKSVGLEYDSDMKILSAVVEHNVNNPAKHYVKKVVVEVNGEKKIEQTFTRQMDGEQQEVVYKIIDVNEGDKIAVIGYCNISGKKKSEIVIGAEPSGGNTK